MMGKTVIILLAGKAGTGKSFFAEKLRSIFELQKYNVEIQHFASVLKYIAKQYFGWDGIKDERGRKLLQHLGDIGREYDKDVWVKNLLELRLFASRQYPQDIVIIDDWRFPNEFDYLNKNCNYSIYKVRMSASNRELLKGGASVHCSETSLPPETELSYYNFVIDNCEGKTDLVKEAKELADYIVQKEDNFR